MLKQNKVVSRSSVLFKLSPCLDAEGLLRVRGRLQTSMLSHEEKHPIILPRDYTSKLLVRFQHRLLKHAGVDTLLTSLLRSYRIIGLRRFAKSVKRECIVCVGQVSKAENCINSRPLTFVSDDVQSKNPITPNHFLTSMGANFGFSQSNTLSARFKNEGLSGSTK